MAELGRLGIPRPALPEPPRDVRLYPPTAMLSLFDPFKERSFEPLQTVAMTRVFALVRHRSAWFGRRSDLRYRHDLFRTERSAREHVKFTKAPGTTFEIVETPAIEFRSDTVGVAIADFSEGCFRCIESRRLLRVLSVLEPRRLDVGQSATVLKHSWKLRAQNRDGRFELIATGDEPLEPIQLDHRAWSSWHASTYRGRRYWTSHSRQCVPKHLDRVVSAFVSPSVSRRG